MVKLIRPLPDSDWDTIDWLGNQIEEYFKFLNSKYDFTPHSGQERPEVIEQSDWELTKFYDWAVEFNSPTNDK